MGVFPKSILTIVMFSLLFSCNIEEGVNTNSIMDNNNQNESTHNISGRSIVFYNVENLLDTKNNRHTDDDDFTRGVGERIVRLRTFPCGEPIGHLEWCFLRRDIG